MDKFIWKIGNKVVIPTLNTNNNIYVYIATNNNILLYYKKIAYKYSLNELV